MHCGLYEFIRFDGSSAVVFCSTLREPAQPISVKFSRWVRSTLVVTTESWQQTPALHSSKPKTSKMGTTCHMRLELSSEDAEFLSVISSVARAQNKFLCLI